MSARGLAAELQARPEPLGPARAVEADHIRRTVAKRRIRVLASLLDVSDAVAADLACFAAALVSRSSGPEPESRAD